jgi:hypothetical protein
MSSVLHAVGTGALVLLILAVVGVRLRRAVLVAAVTIFTAPP